MNGEPSLLAAILAEPEDDAPRLVYADQLSDAGDPRGEFIQLQCLLRRRMWGVDGSSRTTPDDPRPPNRDELLARQFALFKAHASTWLAPARPYVQRWSWHRGFLDLVESNAKFLPGARTVLAAHPVRLALTSLKPPELATLVDAELDDLRALELRASALTPTAVRGLVGENLQALHVLDLGISGIRDEGVAALATASHLGALRRLSLRGARLGDAGVAAIAVSKILSALRTLDITNTGVGEAGVGALAAAKLPNLQKVLLGAHVTNAAGPDVVAALAKRFEVVTTD